MDKVLILGGAGAMGQIIVRDLAEYSDAHVVVADFDEQRAKQVAERLKNSRITGHFADMNDHAGLVSLLKGTNVIVNSTPYYRNVAVMQAALEAGCHYLDLGGLFHVTRKQLELNDQFKTKNLLAILGMGAAPGLTNVMAAVGAKELDIVESIDIFIGAIDSVEIDHPLAPPYSLDTILDEYTLEPMVFENGQFAAKPPMSGSKQIEFPQPVGRTTAILTLHSEVATLPKTYAAKGIKRVTFRLGLPSAFHEKMKLIVDLGFGSSEKIETKDGGFVPRKVLAKMLEKFPTPQQDPNDCEVIRVDVAGHKGGKDTLVRLETTVMSDAHKKISSGALDTGIPPAIVVQMILDQTIKGSGALAPEIAVPAESLFKELTKRNIEIKKYILAAEAA